MTGWHDEDSQEKKQFWKMTGLVICETYCLRVAWRTPIRGPTIAPVQTWSWIFSLAWIGLKKTGLEWLNLQGEVLTQGLEGGGPPSPRTAGVNLPEREKVDDGDGQDKVDDDLCEALLVLAIVDIRRNWMNNSWPTLHIHHDVQRLVPGGADDDNGDHLLV